MVGGPVPGGGTQAGKNAPAETAKRVEVELFQIVECAPREEGRKCRANYRHRQWVLATPLGSDIEPARR